MDPATGTVLVEAALDTRPTQARSGQIVSLAITPKPVAPRAVVPLAALRDGTGMRATLLLVSPGASSAKRFAVEIEEVDQGRVYLRTAVPPGAQVIVSGGQFVREGAALTVTEEGPGATAR
jgi:multidrug efflux pump subunit AcrA (membrane-fusion protein)